MNTAVNTETVRFVTGLPIPLPNGKTFEDVVQAVVSGAPLPMNCSIERNTKPHEIIYRAPRNCDTNIIISHLRSIGIVTNNTLQ